MVSLDWVRKWYINVLDLLDPVSVCKVYDEVYDPKTSDQREFMYDEWLFVRQDWQYFSSGLTMDRWPQLRFMFYKVGVSLQVSNPKIVFLIQLRWLFKSFKRGGPPLGALPSWKILKSYKIFVQYLPPCVEYIHRQIYNMYLAEHLNLKPLKMEASYIEIIFTVEFIFEVILTCFAF